MRRRRGQAALEFLTTYGWALLIILVMIGAISYFGVMNPSKLLPERCTSSPEFSCQDYELTAVDGGYVNVVLKQGIGKTIIFEEFTCRYAENPEAAITTGTCDGNGMSAEGSWSPTASCTFKCPATTLASLKGEKVKAYFDITYRKSTSSTLTHSASGEIYAEVK